MPPTSSSPAGRVEATAPTLPPETVTAVVGEATHEILAKHGGPAADGTLVTYAVAGHDDRCRAPDDCLPLGPLLDVPGGRAGHLHRSVDNDPQSPDVDRRPPVGLELLGELVVARVSRDLLDVRLARRDHDVEHLLTALDTNRTIGIAVGVVMVTQRCTATEAFELLKAASQNQNRKLREIAEDINYTGVIPAGAQPPTPAVRTPRPSSDPARATVWSGRDDHR